MADLATLLAGNPEALAFFEKYLVVLLAFFEKYLVVFLIAGIALYLYNAIALMAIASRKKAKNSWLAFIPIANIYLMTQVAKLSGWWTLCALLTFIPLAFIPFVGGLLMAVVLVYVWWKLAEALGRPGWWGILMLIPIVNLVIIGIMAWGK